MGKELFYDKYEIIQPIGSGGFGDVFLVNDVELDEKFALKKFNTRKFLHNLNREDLLKKYGLIAEIKRGLKLNHPYVLRYYFASSATEKTMFGKEKIEFGIMDYCPEGHLGKYLQKNDLSLAKKVDLFSKILEGVIYLHKKGIIHRDLKPSNILMEEGTPKIMDFGISKDLSDASGTTSFQFGAVEYMAPEVIFPKTFRSTEEHYPKIDVWGFGVVLYQALSGGLPFGSRKHFTADEIKSNISKKGFNVNLRAIPSEFHEILRNCFEKYPHKRENASVLLTKLRKLELSKKVVPIKTDHPAKTTLSYRFETAPTEIIKIDIDSIPTNPIIIDSLNYSLKWLSIASFIGLLSIGIWFYNSPQEQYEWGLVEMAANNGYPVAQYEMGVNLYHGKSRRAKNVKVSEDDKIEALEWFRKSEGYPASDAYVGQMYYRGEGGLQVNKEESFKYYHNAANKGLGEAQFQLGKYFQVGIGIPMNKDSAKFWYNKAAENNFEPAKEALQRME